MIIARLSRNIIAAFSLMVYVEVPLAVTGEICCPANAVSNLLVCRYAGMPMVLTSTSSDILPAALSSSSSYTYYNYLDHLSKVQWCPHRYLLTVPVATFVLIFLFQCVHTAQS